MRVRPGVLGAVLVTSAVAVAGACAVGACSTFSAQDGSASPDGAADDAAVPMDAASGSDSPTLDAAADRSIEVDASPSVVGCADGTREAFTGPDLPRIAACSGAWDVPGLFADGLPACGRSSGNDGANKSGAGCNAQDLCAAGWHICLGAAEVTTHGGMTAAGPCSATAVDGKTFYATAQPSDGLSSCAPGPGFNDIFGCGDVGDPPNGDCTPLNRCSGGMPLPLFALGPVANQERKSVTKGPGPGGVLCCAD